MTDRDRIIYLEERLTDLGIRFEWVEMQIPLMQEKIERLGQIVSKTEPQRDCLTCKHSHDKWYHPYCDSCSRANSNYEPKTEPQTEDPPMDEYYKDLDEEWTPEEDEVVMPKDEVQEMIMMDILRQVRQMCREIDCAGCPMRDPEMPPVDDCKLGDLPSNWDI